jgi:hypothetical protein
MKNTVEEIQEEINSKLKENIEVINQRANGEDQLEKRERVQRAAVEPSKIIFISPGSGFHCH